MKNILQKMNFHLRENLLILIIFIVIVTIIWAKIVYSKNQNLNSELEKTKMELLRNKYFLDLKFEIKQNKQDIPELDEKLRDLRLKTRCLESQIQRVLNNEKVDELFCEIKENLENFSNANQTSFTKEKATNKKVVFSLPTKQKTKLSKQFDKDINVPIKNKDLTNIAMQEVKKKSYYKHIKNNWK